MAHAFGCAAAEYDDLAALQRQIGDRLLTGLPARSLPGWMMDLGAGTGWCSRHLDRRYPDRPLLVLDIAAGMLRQVQSRSFRNLPGLLVGDMEALPLASGCAGLVVSNLALQWCVDPAGAMAEMARVLQPGGRLLLTTFVSGTLEGLRQAWSEVDDYTHVNEFLDVHRLDEYLAAAGFHHWEVSVHTMSLAYDSLLGLFRELKGIGAHNVTEHRPRHLMGKGRLRSLEKSYPKVSGRINASFVVAYVTAIR